MLTLLLWVCILGVIAWVLTRIPMPEPFRSVAYGILLILLLIVLFQTFAGGGFPSLR